jgi:XTP/dITP diphosphohydrolase
VAKATPNGGRVERSLVLATNNSGKVAEFRVLLRNCGWQMAAPADRGLTLSVDECGTSYLENATLKARAFARASGLFALADDSGLEVDALNGTPGVRSARYGGEDLAPDQRLSLLLSALGETPDNRRGARFCCTLVLAAPDGALWHSEGVCEGTIAREPTGQGGFGYDPVFFLPDLGRTMAQLTPAEKNRVSHRGRACAALCPVLQDLAALVNGGQKGTSQCR